MAKLLLSIQGGRSAEYCFKKIPSEFIPFKGEFPIVENYRFNLLYQQIRDHRYLDECDLWVQDAIIKADRIFLMEKRFKEYLEKQGKLDTFQELSNPEKATLLVKFMDSDCLGWDSLTIK
jgi:hypothetical protein